MEVGILGLGSIGSRHLRYLNEEKSRLDINKIYGFDTSKDRMTKASNDYPNLTTAESEADLARSADIIYLCTPTSSHIPIMKRLIDASDAHIFVEKPLSHTLQDCEKIVIDLKNRNRIIHVGYMLRRHPILVEIRKRITAGTIGRVLTVRAEAGFYLPYWHPWEDYRAFYMAWRTGGGGALLDISHELDYLIWLFGDVSNVSANVGRISDLEITSDDLAYGYLEFKSGIKAQFHLDLLQHDESRFLKLIGTDGVMIGDLVKNEIRCFHMTTGKWQVDKFDCNWDDVYKQQMFDYFEACKSGRLDEEGIHGALETMHVVEAARLSSATGSAVRLPLYV